MRLVVEKLERKVNRYTRNCWAFLQRCHRLPSTAGATSLRLPLRSIVEEYKLSKIRTQWMLNNSADSRIREDKPLLRSERKFRPQNEIDGSVAELMFEEVRGPTQTDRHAVGWNHLSKWSQASSSVRAVKTRKGAEKWSKTESRGRFSNHSRVSGQRGKTLQRSLTWSDMWKMSPLRLAFAIRSVYDQFPSRDNLQKWGLVEDTKCGLCGGTETLHQVLSNCTYALANGRYTWRHNQVFREVCEAAKAAVTKVNSRAIAKQRKIYLFLFFCTPLQKEISNSQARHSCRHKRLDRRSRPRKDKALPPDADRKWQEAGLGARVVVDGCHHSGGGDGTLQYSNALKADKYADLSMDLEAKGYLTDLFPIEFGARGVVGRSTYLAKIGLPSRERTKAMTRMSEATEAASFWIWHMRSQKKS